MPGETRIPGFLLGRFFLGISTTVPLFLPCEIPSSIRFLFPLHAGLNSTINRDESQPEYVGGGGRKRGRPGTGRGGEGVEIRN